MPAVDWRASPISAGCSLFLSAVERQTTSRASGLGTSCPVQICSRVTVDVQNRFLWPTAISELNEAQLCDQSQHHAINLSSSRHETRCGLTQLSASSPHRSILYSRAHLASTRPTVLSSKVLLNHSNTDWPGAFGTGRNLKI